MTSISGSRSGGKILRSRRNAATAGKTPYDRPPRSPNWLSRFVLSPTRFVAGKLVSSVLDLESSPTSSSASDSGDEEIATVKDNSDIPFEGDNAVKKGLQPLIGSGANKHVIEQLLMQETFSREEGDRLISIIRSRRVDYPAEDDGDKRPRDMPNSTLGSDSPDLYSAAVMEAKKWLQEKKLGLDSNSDLGYGSHSLTSVKLPQAFEDGGSPVDVAKSYMRIRPAWVSPSVDHNKPPSPIGIQLFKNETPYLIGGISTSYFKEKRGSPAAGSWSIQDEIRRVQSRTTEQMLRRLPSSKVDWSALSMEYKSNANSSAIENIEASLEQRVHNFTNAVDASSKLDSGLSTQVSPDLERKQESFQHETWLSDPANMISEHKQDFGAYQQTIGSQSDCREITTSGQKHGSSDDVAPMMHSFCAGHVIEQNTKRLDIEHNTVDSGQQGTAKGALELETCKLFSETSMKVPDAIGNNNLAVNEDSVATGLRSSSSTA
ncbi:protein KAKU4-like isoform X1 [Gastrolobium bilobum]|uniref:protein KAKU4-like isoform X1 n=1 Tax=Gastrolobium bilobum TaxID=150636 RepID=UPI002AB11975|nr:protein KAKU4-like isoform X1 [Gastrolobium bilobum]